MTDEELLRLTAGAARKERERRENETEEERLARLLPALSACKIEKLGIGDWPE